jgi:aminodeoxyfutalosine synthase
VTMMTATTFDSRMERIAAGGRLTAEELDELSSTPDVLAIGMLADAARRLRGTRVTYLRVANAPTGGLPSGGLAPAAREVRLTGSPGSLRQALTAIESVRPLAEQRTIAGFSWIDVARWANQDGRQAASVLAELRAAGLDVVAELPLDAMPDPAAVIDALQQSGFGQFCLGTQRAGADRLDLWRRASELQDRFGCIQALNPLPTELRVSQPTTGYDDVKAVAMARLAAPGIPSIQVDWQRYGPKLAQVALTFGADDLWGVSPFDESPEGRRRAPVEEVRRNIEAAGFEPVERDGRFATLA